MDGVSTSALDACPTWKYMSVGKTLALVCGASYLQQALKMMIIEWRIMMLVITIKVSDRMYCRNAKH